MKKMNLPACAPALIALLSGACSAPPARATLPSSRRIEPALIRVGVREGNRTTIRKVPFESYVEGAIISELAPASGDGQVAERMFEVQAVIARTYALAHLGRHEAEGFDVCATTHCQLYQPSRLATSRWAIQVGTAVERTSGTVLWFDDGPAITLFHADCGGRTSGADEVWGGAARPYLASIVDDGPAQDAHVAWHYEISGNELRAALNKDLRTHIGSRLDGVEVLERDSAGRAERIAIRGTEDRRVRGEELRDAISQTLGARTVKSTRFELRRDQDRFIFDGRGFGHGVGLCQAGALARVRAGSDVPAVLARYFSGTRLLRLRGSAAHRLLTALKPQFWPALATTLPL